MAYELRRRVASRLELDTAARKVVSCRTYAWPYRGSLTPAYNAQPSTRRCLFNSPTASAFPFDYCPGRISAIADAKGFV